MTVANARPTSTIHPTAAAAAEAAQSFAGLGGAAGRPEWVADTIAFVASDAASYISGTRLAVDGGISVT